MELLNKILKGNNEEKNEAFYNLCSADLNAVQIKKLLSFSELKNHIDSKLLLTGLLAAIDNKRDKYINFILEFIEENKINLTQEQINTVFNFSAESKDYKTINYLDKKFFVIEKNLSSTTEGYYGKFDLPGYKPIYKDVSRLIYFMESYSINPFTFNLIKKDFKVLDKMLEKDCKISLSLVKAAFIHCINEGNTKSAMYLINHKKTSKFLTNNGTIKEALTDNKEYPEFKKEISIILDQRQLERILKTNNETLPKKLKL